MCYAVLNVLVHISTHCSLSNVELVASVELRVEL